MKSTYKKILLSLTLIILCLNIYSLSYVEEYDFLLSDLKNYCTYGYKTTYDDVLDKSQGIINLSQGALQSTDFPLDIGIVGNGFFKVVDEDGNQFYSRYGKLSIDFDTGAFYIICNNKKYFLDLSKVSGDFYFPDNIKIRIDGSVEYTTYKNIKSSLPEESEDKLIRSLSDHKIVYLSEINDEELQKRIDEYRRKLEENKVIESAGKILLYDITENNIESYDGYLIKTKMNPSVIENPHINSGFLEMSNVYLDKILIRMLFVIERLSNSQIKQKETKKYLIKKMLEPDFVRVKMFGYFYEQNPDLYDVSGLKDFVHFLDRFYE